ncbi:MULTISPECIES: glycosyltransferase 87 family protein [unclassified Mesorhizobium]|uniref:glycosyltransferase 87 family protein n=1 Tax=unclassified Mesorhizobium TaxID=325217 RepID=UPI001CCF1F35|nr:MULTISPECIES: glycosyltransferase 87 family protein [unclassified Mesorhizobium]MBZ9742479.1 glycosyltransferase 87 family protein [Mesorhizobium sp. CO1-1-4]MBZ9801042.1 glycosyltransferase 87 family protein [Mesorhizobium sp. ES1-6]
MLTKSPAPQNPLDRLVETGLAWGEGTYARLAAPIGAAAFALYILLTAFTAWVMPDANWDMLPYLAISEEGTYPNPQALHDYAYDTVKSGVSAGGYKALTDDGGGFRSHMAENAADFHSLLGMYRIKFLYAEILSTLSAVMSPVAAMRLVQVFSVLLFGAITLLWLRGEKALALAPVIGAVLIMADFGDAARASTPDLLTSALLLGGLYAYVRGREAATAILLFLAFMVRPDNIVFLAIFAILLVAFRQKAWGALAGFAASFVAYFAISHWAHHPGWWPHLWFSSIEQHYDMDGFEPAFSLIAYLKAFSASLLRAVNLNRWVGVSVLALAGWFAAGRAGFRLDRRAGILFAALVLGALAKFTVFPIHDTRIYFPHLIPPFLLLAPPFMALWAAVTRGQHRAALHVLSGDKS